MIDFEAFCIHNDIDYSISYNELDFYPRGFVFKKPNGKYHIALNGKHNTMQLQETFMHELGHIMENHLDLDVSFRDLVEEDIEFVVKEMNYVLGYNFG